MTILRKTFSMLSKLLAHEIKIQAIKMFTKYQFFFIMEVPIVQSNINKEPFQRPFLRALGKEFLPYDFPKPFQSDFVYL